MHLDKYAKQFLAYIGWQVQRVPTPLKKRKNSSSNAGLLVEMVGPSGVGKSYLCDKILSNKKTHGWMSRENVSAYMRYYKELSSEPIGNSEMLETLLQWRYEKIWASKTSVLKKIQKISFVNQMMAVDICAHQYLLPHCGYLSDEGIAHNFTLELIDWYKLRATNNQPDKERLMKFLKGRSFIFVDAPDAYILNNLISRQKKIRSNESNNYFSYMEKERIILLTQQVRDSKQRWLMIAEKLGVPILELDASDCISLNTRKIALFVDKK